MFAADMDSLEKDIGQLLWVGIDGPTLSPSETDWLSAGKAGVVVLFGRNIKTDGDGAGSDLQAVRELNRSIHEIGGTGKDQILVAVDQEGGRVQRIRAPLPKWPAMLHHDALADGESEETAEAVGAKIGSDLRDLDFDIDFAPVLDVHTRDENPIIGDRAFSKKPERAARLALAFARGLKSAGILSCGKHFPGHGDTDTDSHLALPILNHGMDRLRATELLPFAEAAKERLPMIMTAHVVFSALQKDVPATLAKPAIDLLRIDLGYDGVIVSDDLDMKAIADKYDVGAAAVLAIQAGCDALLLCRDKGHQSASFAALYDSCKADKTTAEKVAIAADRIRRMKRMHQEARRRKPQGITESQAAATQQFLDFA